jgi:hypothetical protein
MKLLISPYPWTHCRRPQRQATSNTLIKRNIMSLYVIEHHAVKMYAGVEVQLHVFVTSTIGRGE